MEMSQNWPLIFKKGSEYLCTTWFVKTLEVKMGQVNSSLWLSIKDRRVQEKEVRD